MDEQEKQKMDTEYAVEAARQTERRVDKATIPVLRDDLRALGEHDLARRLSHAQAELCKALRETRDVLEKRGAP